MKKFTRKNLLRASTLTLSLMVSTFSYAADLTDGQIVAIYNQVNTFDIEIAGLSRAHGHDSQVVALGTMVQNDHTGVRQLASDLAAKLDMVRTLPYERVQALADHLKIVISLSSKTGSDFDKAYLEHEIDFHTAAIDAVKNVLIPSAKNQELIDLMEGILPGFEHHLSESKRVYQELGYTLNSNSEVTYNSESGNLHLSGVTIEGDSSGTVYSVDMKNQGNNNFLLTNMKSNSSAH